MSAYLDGFEPLEKVLAIHDAELMRRIEGAMGEFRAAIKRGAHRELTEGFGSLFAAIILVWVGIWMHGKSQSDAWQRYIHDKLGHALSRGSAWGLFGLTFIVVYREVFETILFYAAIWNEESVGAVMAGAGTAVVVLAAIAWALMRYGRALPVGKFFAYSSALLAIICVVLAGKGYPLSRKPDGCRSARSRTLFA